MGILLLGAASRSPARPTLADDVCPPTADPCIVASGTVISVTEPSVLDFGSRALILSGGSGTRFVVSPGVSLVVRAGSLTMNTGSGLLGPGADITVDVRGSILIASSGNGRARIDVADALAPGSITLVAGTGDIVVEGIVDASAKSGDAGLGSISIFPARDLIVSGDILASGPLNADGGLVTANAGRTIDISGVVDASGSEGGFVELTAGSRIVTSGSGTARLDVRAVGSGGSGGDICLTTPGDVTLGAPLHLQGEASPDFGGDGGFLTIDAGRTVTIGAALNLFGTVPDGTGGDLDLTAGLDIVQTGPIAAQGRRSFGFGGDVTLSAGRTAQVGSIDVRGDCELCIGGEIAIETGCGLTVPGNAILDATGIGGFISFETGGPLTVAGTLAAGDAIDFRYHPAAPAPDLTGASISPTPTVTPSTDVVPCQDLPAANCGNGALDTGEECDDGNVDSCDGCSSICRIELPGNGRVDCGEICDDGNLESCDGCAADLSREDAICGDGVTECGEECDDGNRTRCDGCSPTCQVERCGNEVPECTEECDLGDAINGTPGASCDETCRIQVPATCGDGVLDPPLEGCDDGGLIDCDAGGCSSLCQPETCGNGRVECDEECDDFNLDPCDGCSPTCGIERCGNGIVECGEECDDGPANGQPGSNCLADLCRPGAICSAQTPGPCIPCAADLDCDPNGLCGGVRCLDGVCTPSPLDCDDGNPCTADRCEPTSGCAHDLRDAAEVPECVPTAACTMMTCDATLGCLETPLSGFPGMRCSVDVIAASLDDPGIDPRVLRKLQKLPPKMRAKLDLAEAGVAGGKRRKVKKGLAKTERLLTKFRKKVERFAGTKLPIDTAATLTSALEEAAGRVIALRADLGV